MKCPYCKSSNTKKETGLYAEHVPYYCLDCQTGVPAEDLPVSWQQRIRTPEDARRRIAEVRARANSDPLLRRHRSAGDLATLYLDACEDEGWIEILAADIWAERELTERLGRKVWRTQVRRDRLLLTRLMYCKQVKRPTRKSNVEALERHRKEKRTKPPIVIQLCL